MTAAIILLVALAIILRQPVLDELRWNGGPRADPKRLESYVRFLTTTALPRSAAHPESLRRTAAWIARSFRESGARVTVQSFEARGKTWENIVAELGPDDHSQPLLIIGAHYDAFGEMGSRPGADDNASGIAAFLELARLLGNAHPHTPLMLIAYTNEEPPFFGSEEMGSAIHASALARENRVVKGMICLEMIGYYARNKAGPRLFSRSSIPLTAISSPSPAGGTIETSPAGSSAESSEREESTSPASPARMRRPMPPTKETTGSMDGPRSW